MKFAFNRTLLFVVLITGLILTLIIYGTLFSMRKPLLRVSFLSVGQGDAIFIESPTGQQVLVDGGVDRSVLRELGRKMNPLDRSIDMVVATHPDKDHIFGLTPVFEQYEIGTFLESGIESETNPKQALDDAVSKEDGVAVHTAKRGMRILIGGGAYIDVLYPYQQQLETLDTNDASIVLRIVYGTTSVLLSGDLSSVYEDTLVALHGEEGLASTVLKAGHHGSKYSTDALFLAHVSPDVLVISAGKDNPYGHPSPYVLDRAKRASVPVVSTAEKGTIRFISDGKKIEQK